MRVCVPVTEDGQVGPAWGKAARLAVADLTDGVITQWQEFEVGWDRTHGEGAEGAHHARIARFLLDRDVEAVVADHMGPPMQNMLHKMGLRVHLDAAGDARAAVSAAV